MYEERWVCYITGIPLAEQVTVFLSNSKKIDHVYAASHFLSQECERKGESPKEGEWQVNVFGRNQWKRVTFNIVKINQPLQKLSYFIREIAKVEDVEEEYVEFI